MSDQWYYVDGGEKRGPVSRERLKELGQTGEIEGATLVWREGLSDWASAASLGLFAAASSPKPPPIPPPLAPPPPPKPTTYSKPLPPRPTARPTSDSSRYVMLAVGAVAVVILAGVIGWTVRGAWDSRREREVASANPPGLRAEQVKLPSRPTEPARTTSGLEAASKSATSVAAPVVASPSAALPAATISPPQSEPAKGTASEVSPAAPNPPVVPVATDAPPKPSGELATTRPASPPASSTPLSPASQAALSQKTQTLYQEVDVQRAPKFTVEGFPLPAQELRYQLLSELQVGEPDQSGNRSVEQRVIDTKLVLTDELSRPTIEPSLQSIKGMVFSYKLNRGGEVIEMAAGPLDAIKAGKIEPKGGKGFLVSSVMDEGGWKELAQLSFFVPDEQASGNQVMKRQMTHDFGPLGSWSGETSLVRKATQKGIQRIDYSHKLTYKPPDKAGGGDLPFAIKTANLKPEVAGGSIAFDTKLRRVVAAEDRFLVKGEVSAEVAGQAATVQLQEEQVIALRIVDQNPWKQ